MCYSAEVFQLCVFALYGSVVLYSRMILAEVFSVVLICSRAAAASLSSGYMSVCVCMHMHLSAQCVIIISLVSLLKISRNGRNPLSYPLTLFSVSLSLSVLSVLHYFTVEWLAF